MRPLPSPTPFPLVFRAQLRSVLSRIGLASILTALVLTFALTVYSLVIRTRTAGGATSAAVTLPFLLMAYTLAMTVAFFLPGLLWKGLAPRDRRALHAQPVDRRPLELIRVAAGGALFVGFMIPVYLLGIFIQVRLGSAAFALPTAGDWLLALGAPLLLYLIGSALALVTPSATGTLVRLVVWGFALALGITMLRERVAAFGTLLDALSRTMFWGSTGVLTALGAGIPGFAGTAGAREATALASWMLLSLLAIRQAAGRLPRRG